MGNYNISWKKFSSIKRSISFSQKNNLIFKEISCFSKNLVEKVEYLKSKWIITRKSHSFAQSFLTPQLDYSLKNNRKAFMLEKNNRIYAFIMCNPLYENGNVIGYAISNVFHEPFIKKIYLIS